MPKVLIIARHFPPEQHSGTLRNEAFANYLSRFGVTPVVLTSQPVIKSGARERMARTVLDNWEDPPTCAEVARCPWPVPRSRSTSLLKRLPLCSSISRRSERLTCVASLLPEARRLIRKHQPDVVVASLAPPETLYLGARLAEEFHIPLLADLRDPWSYAAGAPYRHFVDFLMERREERRLLEQCTHVTVTSQASRRLLVEKLGLRQAKVSVIENGFDGETLSKSLEPGALDEGRFVIAHLGELAADSPRRGSFKARVKQILGFDYVPLKTDTSARSPRWLLMAAERMIRNDPGLQKKVRFWFVGINESLRYNIFDSFPFPECLRIIPRVPTAEAARIARSADLLLLLQNQYFLDGKDFCVAIAAKTYTYLAAGRPILACLQPSEMADLVRQYADGRVVGPTDVSGIQEALNFFLTQNGEHAPNSPLRDSNSNSIQHLSRLRQAREFASLLQRLSGNSSGDWQPDYAIPKL